MEHDSRQAGAFDQLLSAYSDGEILCAETDRLRYGFGQLSELIDDRLSLETLSLPKDYRKGRVRFLLELDGLVGHVNEHHPAIYSLDFADVVPSDSHSLRRQTNGGYYDHNCPVFVGVVERIKAADVSLPSVGALHFADQSGGYPSIVGRYMRCDGRFESFGVAGDGELGFHDGLLTPARRKARDLARNVIERRSKVMGNVTHQDVEHRGRWEGGDAEASVTSFRITIGENLFLVHREEGGEHCVQLIDVLFGPFDL